MCSGSDSCCLARNADVEGVEEVVVSDGDTAGAANVTAELAAIIPGAVPSGQPPRAVVFGMKITSIDAMITPWTSGSVHLYSSPVAVAVVTLM